MLQVDRPLSELEQKVYDNISTIEDPELFIKIVELGLVYDIHVDEIGKCFIKMTFTSMACPAGPSLKSQVTSLSLQTDGITDVDVEVVWNPAWDPRIMASEDAKMELGIYD
jgi:metal-sulfur cluster biosynthetic enzyme